MYYDLCFSHTTPATLLVLYLYLAIQLFSCQVVNNRSRNDMTTFENIWIKYRAMLKTKAPKPILEHVNILYKKTYSLCWHKIILKNGELEAR